MDLVERVYERVLKDEVLSKFFQGHDLARIKEMHQSLVLSTLSGGYFPSHHIRCHHEGLHIRSSDYARFLEIYETYLTEVHVETEDITSILNTLFTYHDLVVTSEDSEV